MHHDHMLRGRDHVKTRTRRHGAWTYHLVARDRFACAASSARVQGPRSVTGMHVSIVVARLFADAADQARYVSVTPVSADRR